jgi:hypothetical protein
MENDTILNVLPIDRTTCFSNDKGEPTEKIRKQQTKLLAKLGPFLKKFLEPEERILYAASAIAPMSKMDMFFKGWHVYYLKSCALVFTDRRVLYLPTTMNGKPKQSLAQARYGDIDKYSIKGILNGAFEIVYKSGRKESFTINSAGDFKKIKAFLPRYLPGGQPTDRRDQHFLCPRCAKPLAKDNYMCPSCRLKFKTPAGLIKKALLIPGGGYFVTGHYWFGVQGALTDLVTIWLAIVLIIGLITKEMTKIELLIFFVPLLFLTKLMTILHVKYFAEQYIPDDKK